MAGMERYSSKTSSTTFAIGDTGPAGGKIFITPSTVGNSTGKYFEASPFLDPDVERSWATNVNSNWTTLVSGADGTAIGTGAQNTIDIVAQAGNVAASSAAAYTNDYTYNGYSDWFLPSKDELNQMYINRGVIGGFDTVLYWSSSEYSATNAYYQDFSTVSQSNYSKNGPMYVRPVRMFSVEPSSFVQRIGNDAVYGPGTDGTVTISGTITLTRDMYYDTLSIPLGNVLLTNGYRVFVKNTLTLNGVVGIGSVSGNTNGSSNGITGESASVVASGTVSGQSTSTSITYRAGGTGGGSTAGSSTSIPTNILYALDIATGGLVIDSTGTVQKIAGGVAGTTGSTGTTTPAYTNNDSWPGKAGASGSAGGAGSSPTHANAAYPQAGGRGQTGNPASPGTATGANPGTGGTGGAGGAGGGVVVIAAKVIAGTGTVMSLGRSGSSGSAGSTGTGGTQGSNGNAGAAGVQETHNNPASHHHHSNPATHHGAYHTHYPFHTVWNANYGGLHHGAVSPQVHLFHRASRIHGHIVEGTGHTGFPHHAFGYHNPHHDGPHGHVAHGSHDHGTYIHHYPVAGHAGPHHYHHHHGNYDGSYHYANLTGGNGPHGAVSLHNENHSAPAHSHRPAAHHNNPDTATHHNNPATVYPGGTAGAGGVNNGTNTGAGAPAVTGGSGKRGGAGGGGGIILITDTTPSGISYDVRKGLTEDSDNYSGSNGYTYVILNA